MLSLQVLALVFKLKLLGFCFTKRELSWLDDLIPESKKKKDDDKKKTKKKKEEVRIILMPLYHSVSVSLLPLLRFVCFRRRCWMRRRMNRRETFQPQP